MLLSVLPALTPVIAVVVCVGLAVVGTLIFGGVGLYAVYKIRARKAGGKPILPTLPSVQSTATAGPAAAGILAHLGQLLHTHTGGAVNPRLAAIARSATKRVLAWDEASDHKELDLLLSHLGIGGAVATPVVNAGLDLLDKRLGISPETPPDLAIGLHQFAAAWWAQHKAKQQQPPAKAA